MSGPTVERKPNEAPCCGSDKRVLGRLRISQERTAVQQGRSIGSQSKTMSPSALTRRFYGRQKGRFKWRLQRWFKWSFLLRCRRLLCSRSTRGAGLRSIRKLPAGRREGRRLRTWGDVFRQARQRTPGFPRSPHRRTERQSAKRLATWFRGISGLALLDLCPQGRSECIRRINLLDVS